MKRIHADTVALSLVLQNYWVSIETLCDEGADENIPQLREFDLMVKREPLNSTVEAEARRRKSAVYKTDRSEYVCVQTCIK